MSHTTKAVAGELRPARAACRDRQRRPGPVASSRVGGFGVVPALGFAQALVLLVLLMGGSSEDAHHTLTATSLAGALGIVVFWGLGLRAAFGSAALWILLASYGLRCLLGIAHYLLWMNPGYFNNPAAFTYHWDFEWMHESLVLVSDHWRTASLLAPLPDSFWEENKNAYLMIYNGLLYYLTGPHSLNIAPWNSLHNTYTAALVGSLALHLGSTRRQAILALGVVAFQPFLILTDVMARDTVGQTGLAIAVYLLVTTRAKPALWALFLPLAAFLGYCDRQPYALVVVAAAGLVLATQAKASPVFTVILALGVLLSFMLTPVFSDLITASLGWYQDMGGFYAYRSRLFPLLLLRAVMGAFPWFQIFDDPPPIGYEFMVPDFLQAVANLALLYLALPRLWAFWKATGTIDPAAVFGLLLFLTGCIAVGVHMTYVSAGMIFLVPAACRCELAAWWRALRYSFVFFILANGLYYVLSLKGHGIIQSITGY
jgi:hypothetical protein